MPMVAAFFFIIIFFTFKNHQTNPNALSFCNFFQKYPSCYSTSKNHELKILFRIYPSQQQLVFSYLNYIGSKKNL